MNNVRRLSEAVWNGDLAEVEALICAGADVNAADEPHQPPLHLAIEQQYIEIARRLIQAGADVNRELSNGWTPLAHAIDIESDAADQAGLSPQDVSTELVALLLEAGAKPTDRAFELANTYGNQKALALLLRIQKSHYNIENTLRLLRYWPHLLLGEVTLERVSVWLSGFVCGCSACGKDWPRSLFAKVLNERGWKESARGEIHQMKEKGYSDDQIVDELIEIYLVAYRQLSEMSETARSDDEDKSDVQNG